MGIENLVEVIMNDYTLIFSENLKTRRKELGLTQKELAEILGYTEKSVSKWESAKAIAPSTVLPQLARCLKCDIDTLFTKASTPEYFLGIDGGGTKTAFLLCNKGGKTIGEVTLGCCNPVDIGLTQAIKILENGIDAVCKDIPRSKISVYAGIAGGITGNNQKMINMFLKSCGFLQYANGSDATNAVSLALGNKNGTAVIMGTGIIAFSQINNKLIRRGGYGYLFEEGGSAFAIVKDALTYALMHEENGSVQTVITELIKSKLSCSSVIDQVAYFYEVGKKGIAELAPLVFDAYKSGDRIAKQIIEKNMEAVARLIESSPETDKKINNVVIVGGLTKQKDIIIPLINKKLKNPHKYTIETNSKPPVLGALAIAQKLYE